MTAAATQRVAVTRLGLETCIGRDPDTFWSNLAKGSSGIRPVEAFEKSGLPCRIGGEVDFTDPEDLAPQWIRRTGRFQRLLYSAVLKALGGRQLPAAPDRLALVVGTGGGGLPAAGAETGFLRRGWRGLDRITMLRLLPNMAAAFVAQRLGIRGPCLTITTACAASCDALGDAFCRVRSGAVDVAIAAGVEAWLTELSIGSFCRMEAVSRQPPERAAQASRPFDADRDGMVPSEGAAALVLESFAHAQRAGRPILAEVLGAASSCDGYHLVSPLPSGEATASAIRSALRQADLRPDQIQHVNAHGTSTRLNDIAETRTLKLAFGSHAHRLAITANKSIFGHASGASGAIESAATVLTLMRQYIPPTLNLEKPDLECDLDYTPREGRPSEIEYALKLNTGFGGQNSAVVFGRAQK